MLLFFIGENVEAAKMSSSSPAEKKENKEESLDQLKPKKTVEKILKFAVEVSTSLPQKVLKKEEKEKKEEKKKKKEEKKKVDSSSSPKSATSFLPMMAVAAAAAISLLTAGAFIAFRLLRRTWRGGGSAHLFSPPIFSFTAVHFNSAQQQQHQ